MEIIPGIQRLKIPIPESTLQYINVYLVRGDDGYLMIDSGWDTNIAFDALERQIGELGISFREITRLLVTHVHADHYGLVGRIKEHSGAKFLLHPAEESLIDTRYVHMDSLLRQMGEWLEKNGVPPAVLPKLQKASLPIAKYVAPSYPDVLINDGDILPQGDFDLQVLWTPGHAPGHVCLYEQRHGLLFSGDQVLPTLTPNVGLHAQSAANPLGDFIASLRKIGRLPVKLVLPGHENPFDGLKNRIKSIISHHDRRIAEIMATLSGKEKNAYEIAQGITWLPDIGGVKLKNLKPFNKRLAILETLSHLELIRHEGKLEKATRNGVVYYRRLQ